MCLQQVYGVLRRRLRSYCHAAVGGDRLRLTLLCPLPWDRDDRPFQPGRPSTLIISSEVPCTGCSEYHTRGGIWPFDLLHPVSLFAAHCGKLYVRYSNKSVPQLPTLDGTGFISWVYDRPLPHPPRAEATSCVAAAADSAAPLMLAKPPRWQYQASCGVQSCPAAQVGSLPPRPSHRPGVPFWGEGRRLDSRECRTQNERVHVARLGGSE